MISLVNNEYLNKSRTFLSNQFDTYQWEINSLTRLISEHKAIKKEIFNYSIDPDESRQELREWRKVSYQLHRRRTELRTIQNKLYRQICEVERAIRSSRQMM